MATSSFSREFVISNPEAVEQFIQALENPTKIQLKKKDAHLEQERKKAVLCKLKSQLALLK